jgi:hypothetical protein
MIIKPMAITRCPYCHAIIDENDKYCNNCGTQLLFPEDDEVDEDIPGEKIVDAEVEEKDYTVEEPEDEKRPAAAKDLDEDLDEELEEELKEEAAETALDELVTEEALGEEAEDVTEEVILVAEIPAADVAEKAPTGGAEAKAEPVRKDETTDELEKAENDQEEDEEEKNGDEDEDEEEEEEGEEKGEKEEIERTDKEDIAKKEDTGALAGAAEKGAEPETGEYAKTGKPLASAGDEEAAIEYITEPAAEADDLAAATAGESAFRAVTFDTKDFDAIGKTVELSKEKIDEFIEGLVDKKPSATPAETPAEEPPPAPASFREPTGSLPPWASTMKGAPVFPPDTTAVEPKKSRAAEPSTQSEEEEVEIFPRRKASDSSIGLPERVSQAPLPFGREETREEAAAEKEVEDETREAAAPQTEPVRPVRPPILPVREPARREAEAAAEFEEAEPHPPFSFSVFFKSKVFDVLFVGIFWLAALWLAANATDRTFFEILGSVSGPMLLLYGVFVFLYFFLFKFFLGETLGDRLFRPRE